MKQKIEVGNTIQRGDKALLMQSFDYRDTVKAISTITGSNE